jgi:hypothetical protein
MSFRRVPTPESMGGAQRCYNFGAELPRMRFSQIAKKGWYE